MKYVIISKARGVFLGAIENLTIFAGENAFGMNRAFCFTNKQLAEHYAKIYLNEKEEYILAEFDIKTNYVYTQDLIKAGYGLHTGDMMNNIPMLTETLQ